MVLGQGLATNEVKVFGEFSKEFNIRGARVLEIGGSVPVEFVRKKLVSSRTSVDPLNANRKVSDRYFEVDGLASDLPADSNEYDYVFSCNAFEHILDLEDSISEIFRVVKPGGVLYSHFGPIWSAPDGHHLEGVKYKRKVYNFWTDNVIPNWYHLLFDPEEFAEILAASLEPELIRLITNYVYHSKQINRMFYEDYLEILFRSDFSIDAVISIGEMDYTPSFSSFGNPLKRSKKINILKRVQERHGKNKKNLRCRDMKVLLSKPGVE